MVETSEQEALAKIRTLLALERNYLAEERTALAEFRTGIAVALIAPSASALIAYIFSVFPSEGTPLFESLIFAFFIILTAIGIWTGLRSRYKLKKIRKKKKILKDCKVDVIRSSKAVYELLKCEFLDIEN